MAVTELCFEFVFLVAMLLKFVTEHHYENTNSVERNLKKLAVLYLKGPFFLDILALIPFNFLLASL